jgi:hypothetical protein
MRFFAGTFTATAISTLTSAAITVRDKTLAALSDILVVYRSGSYPKLSQAPLRTRASDLRSEAEVSTGMRGPYGMDRG